MENKVLVLTSTGHVGSALVQDLVKAGETVKAATRDPEKMDTTSGVEPTRFDLHDPSTFAAALEEVDRIFLLTPSGELEPDKLMIPFLEEATRGGRKIVLMSADGVQYNEAAPLRKVEHFLENSGVPYIFLRPNWFMDNFHNSMAYPIRQYGVIAVPAEEGRSAFIDARDIAACAAAVLTTDRFDKQAFSIGGPESLTYGEAAAILAAAAGREIQYTPIDEATFKQTMLATGMPEPMVNYMAVLFSYVRMGASAQVTGEVEKLTGKPPRTLAQYAADHAAAWK